MVDKGGAPNESETPLQQHSCTSVKTDHVHKEVQSTKSRNVLTARQPHWLQRNQSRQVTVRCLEWYLSPYKRPDSIQKRALFPRGSAKVVHPLQKNPQCSVADQQGLLCDPLTHQGGHIHESCAKSAGDTEAFMSGCCHSHPHDSLSKCIKSR